MKWKPRLQRLISPFISATLVLLLLLCFAYPAMLMEAKEQRQNDIRLQVDQIARSFEKSVLNIVTALIEMESLPRDCSPYVQRKFYFYRIARKTSPFTARMNSATAKPFCLCLC